uniref:Uncharacterized protein n=1 Tax=Rhizophora mucronata TaxID=61149 RepID=A0A2P2NS60_RHIMU
MHSVAFRTHACCGGLFAFECFLAFMYSVSFKNTCLLQWSLCCYPILFSSMMGSCNWNKVENLEMYLLA